MTKLEKALYTATRVEKLEGATQVINSIEVLPLSTFDDQLRLALYRRIFNFNSPLFRYGTWSIPPSTSSLPKDMSY